MDTKEQVIPFRNDTLAIKSAEPRHGVVSSTGTVRRLQALIAIGHSQTDLAARLGVRTANLSPIIHGRKPRVSAKTHAAVHAVFVELWANPVEGRPGDRSRTLARLHGWVGPLAWDDIDDPTEVPDISGIKPGQPKPKRSEQLDEIAVELAMDGAKVKLNPAERRLAVTRLHSRRWSDSYIAATLRIDPRSVLRIRQELGLEAFDFSEIRQVESA